MFVDVLEDIYQYYASVADTFHTFHVNVSLKYNIILYYKGEST